MADNKSQGFSAVGNPNPDTSLVLVVRELDTRLEQFDNWVSKQCLPIEVAITTLTNALAGAITGACWDVVFEGACSALSIRKPPKGCKLNSKRLARFGGHQPLIQSMVAGPRLEQARSFAVMYGVDSGLSCLMKKLRGKDDAQTSMVAAFGSGVMVSLVSGVRGPEVMSLGVLFALLCGAHSKVQDKLSQLKAEDVSHDKTRDLFSSIGLGVDHAMNFNTGLFTSNALSLLKDRKETMKGGRKTWF